MKPNRIVSLALIALFTMLLTSCGSGSSGSGSYGSAPMNSVASSGSGPAGSSGVAANTSSSIAPAARPEWIMFSTTWCTICKGMRPTINALKADYQAKVQFVEYDREDAANAAIVKKYNINAQPVFIFFDKNGNMTQEIIGGTDQATLQAALDKVSQ